MVQKKKKRLLLLRYLQKNDVVLRIYTSFALLLTLTGVLIGVIFMMLYEKNYVQSYVRLLSSQGKAISKRVSGFAYKEKPTGFGKYITYIDEMEQAENTDVWVVTNKGAKKPLGDGYVNAQIEKTNLSADMVSVVEQAFLGKTASRSSHDKVYGGMTTLCVAVPVKDKGTKEVIGAVIMVSMIDRQTMGISEGRYLISLSVIAAIVLSYLVAVIFSGFLSRPLDKIGKRISALAGGDYSRINVKRPYSQIGILEKSLNYLSGELQRSATEREELERARMDFFANVSHELRTPITVMRGYTETLADGILEEKEQITELYGRMLQECRGMERLVGDLFILSKMQNPDFQIEKEPVSLAQVFQDVIRSGKMVGKEKGIQISLSVPEEDPCLILGDYGRLRQMFLIIVDNAVKFSREQGKIDIVIEKKENRYYVSIQDYGVGISKEQLPFIFEKFYTSKMRQNEKGTGLGLMIARQIALRHDGDIQVESVEQEGTIFRFDFEECTCVEDFI
ncbi:MAG TPA: hypothetical protein DDY31_03835 [Lachnospiraceae bacterium]|nr:hypothetical protein [Lachnospiraceae bacterium]